MLMSFKILSGSVFTFIVLATLGEEIEKWNKQDFIKNLKWL